SPANHMMSMFHDHHVLILYRSPFRRLCMNHQVPEVSKDRISSPLMSSPRSRLSIIVSLCPYWYRRRWFPSYLTKVTTPSSVSQALPSESQKGPVMSALGSSRNATGFRNSGSSWNEKAYPP